MCTLPYKKEMILSLLHAEMQDGLSGNFYFKAIPLNLSITLANIYRPSSQWLYPCLHRIICLADSYRRPTFCSCLNCPPLSLMYLWQMWTYIHTYIIRSAFQHLFSLLMDPTCFLMFLLMYLLSFAFISSLNFLIHYKISILTLCWYSRCDSDNMWRCSAHMLPYIMFKALLRRGGYLIFSELGLILKM